MISLPRLLCIRGGARREIGSALDQFGIRRPLLITDKFMVKAGHAGELVDLASDVCRPCSLCPAAGLLGVFDAGLL